MGTTEDAMLEIEGDPTIIKWMFSVPILKIEAMGLLCPTVILSKELFRFWMNLSISSSDVSSK